MKPKVVHLLNLFFLVFFRFFTNDELLKMSTPERLKVQKKDFLTLQLQGEFRKCKKCKTKNIYYRFFSPQSIPVPVWDFTDFAALFHIFRARLYRFCNPQSIPQSPRKSLAANIPSPKK